MNRNELWMGMTFSGFFDQNYRDKCRPRWSRGIVSGRKNPEHKSSGRDFKLEVPSLRFQAR